jgi:peptidoglycan-associated lipoprotein
MAQTQPLPETSQPSTPAPPGSLPPEVQVAPLPGIAVQSVPSPGSARGTEQKAEQGGTPVEASPLQDVFYDYNTAAIRDDQKAAITADAAWLQAHPGTAVVIEGHCDERGTDEYNLALGERRARAVKDALVAAGISADRISTVSFGKEQPFVPGHDEASWKWNRRAHVVLRRK